MRCFKTNRNTLRQVGTGQGWAGPLRRGDFGTPLRCAAADPATPPPSPHTPEWPAPLRSLESIVGIGLDQPDGLEKDAATAEMPKKKQEKGKRRREKRKKSTPRKENAAFNGSASGPPRKWNRKMVEHGGRVAAWSHSLQVLGLDMAGLHGVLHSSFWSAHRPRAPARCESPTTLEFVKVPANNDINMLNNNTTNTDFSIPNRVR